jgi:hypothetical protein
MVWMSRVCLLAVEKKEHVRKLSDLENPFGSQTRLREVREGEQRGSGDPPAALLTFFDKK